VPCAFIESNLPQIRPNRARATLIRALFEWSVNRPLKGAAMRYSL
jgi:hypothetical protein